MMNISGTTLIYRNNITVAVAVFVTPNY